MPPCRFSGETLYITITRWPLSDPEEARIPVPDARFDWLADVYKPKSQVPAFLTCIDIAGLTAGASTGAGLGNAFLSHVRAVDGIFQVVRAFDDAEVIHVEGDVDPCRDMQIISTELRLKDIEWVEKELEKLKKVTRGLGSISLADKAKKEEQVSLLVPQVNIVLTSRQQ
jgi:obg-like ATPase 1